MGRYSAPGVFRAGVFRPLCRLPGGDDGVSPRSHRARTDVPAVPGDARALERGTCTVKQLADVLQLDHGTLTPLLRRMETNGLLTRRRADADERFVEIALTPQGSALRAHASKLHCDMKEAMGIDDAGLAALQATLRTLTANVAR